MSDVEIVPLDNGRIALVSPYHPNMPADAKAIGGRWNPSSYHWEFDGRDEQRVRALARKIYGTDGSAADEADKVTIRWTVSSFCHRKGDNTLRIGGRLVADRQSRDDDVRLGDGVILISGGFPGSAGSMQYPSLSPREDTVLEVRDLPRALLEDLDADYFLIVGETVDVDALIAERARLLERLAEIDATLTRHGPTA